ncbi:acyltransferase family protein [Streptomyces sp. NPDC092307]|uniref:acyltransferase family protein n=1 Tax=Streptomyces sp. NPDC092307 TaxID=3366013 RepID=UPI00382D9076
MGGPGGGGSAPGSRLGRLDALRGIAAPAVAAHHFEITRLIPHGDVIAPRFDLGFYGVIAFFIVSGSIIPAWLERRGDVRACWIGRIFRICPAVIVAMLRTDPSGSACQGARVRRSFGCSCWLRAAVHGMGRPSARSVRRILLVVA